MADRKLIDLYDLDEATICENGAEIELRHPATREGLNQFIKIVGQDIKATSNYIAKNENLKRRRAFEAARRGKSVEPTTIEQDNEITIGLMAVCTVGFRNIMWNGKPLEFSQDNAKMLYTERAWIARQIDEAICLRFRYRNFA